MMSRFCSSDDGRNKVDTHMIACIVGSENSEDVIYAIADSLCVQELHTSAYLRKRAGSFREEPENVVSRKRYQEDLKESSDRSKREKRGAHGHQVHSNNTPYP